MSGPDQTSLATLFVYRKTWLHRHHPFNKLAFILLTGVTVYLGPDAWYVELLCIALNLGLAISGKVLQRTWGLMWRALLPLAFCMFLIHGFLYPENQTVLVSFSGVHFYLEGVLFALAILLQLTAVLTASLNFVLCTHPTDLTTAISQAGFPQSLAYLIGSPMLLLPIMRARITTIQDAQRSRGLNSEGNICNRILALFPLLAPVVLGALIELEQRSIALELRGFNCPGPKTSYRTLSDTSRQRFFRRAMLLLSVLVIVYRIWK